MKFGLGSSGDVAKTGSSRVKTEIEGYKQPIIVGSA